MSSLSSVLIVSFLVLVFLSSLCLLTGTEEVSPVEVPKNSPPSVYINVQRLNDDKLDVSVAISDDLKPWLHLEVGDGGLDTYLSEKRYMTQSRFFKTLQTDHITSKDTLNYEVDLSRHDGFLDHPSGMLFDERALPEIHISEELSDNLKQVFKDNIVVLLNLSALEQSPMEILFSEGFEYGELHGFIMWELPYDDYERLLEKGLYGFWNITQRDINEENVSYQLLYTDNFHDDYIETLASKIEGAIKKDTQPYTGVGTGEDSHSIVVLNSTESIGLEEESLTVSTDLDSILRKFESSDETS
ncbi:MAG: hypothetical protein ACLFNK_01780 [Candidatus Woesearchaeota archaeon]